MFLNILKLQAIVVLVLIPFYKNHLLWLDFVWFAMKKLVYDADSVQIHLIHIHCTPLPKFVMLVIMKIRQVISPNFLDQIKLAQYNKSHKIIS